MIVIDNVTIYINRGDPGTLKYSIKQSDDTPYTFQIGDEIELLILEKNGYPKNPVFSKKVIVEQEATSIDINLTEEEMKIGEVSNKPQTYWYQISLNGKVINGYDKEDGASEFIILPGKDDE